MLEKLNIKMLDSINRPAWTQDDLHAYKHLHLFQAIKRDYFIKESKRGSNSSR